MDLDDSSSPDEKEFPGLYEKNAVKSKKGSEENESNSSENVPSKKSKDKDKDKKSKDKKDRQSYEALGGESEEDDGETKLFRSPSKSKKSKTFKFPSSSKKEKREKSREHDTDAKDTTDGTKDKKLKEDSKADKKKSKKEKEKKLKAGSASTEVFELGGEFLLHQVLCIVESSPHFRYPANLWCFSRSSRREIAMPRRCQDPTRREKLH